MTESLKIIEGSLTSKRYLYPHGPRFFVTLSLYCLTLNALVPKISCKFYFIPHFGNPPKTFGAKNFVLQREDSLCLDCHIWLSVEYYPPPPPPGLYSSHINHLYIPYLPYKLTIPSPQLGTGHNTYKTLKIGPSAPVGIAVPAHSLLKQRKTDPHSARQGPNSRTGIMLFNVEKDTGLCSQYYQMPDLVSALQ